MALEATSSRISSIALKTLGFLGVVFLALILLGIVGGPTFRPVLEFVGLDIPGYKGIFVDCSLYENRYNEFCKKGGKKFTHGQERPGTMRPIEKGAMPFNLFD